MDTNNRSTFWNAVHDRCLSRLTAQFQTLDNLKFSPTDGARGYDDLVTWGLAVVRRTPITNHGIACGQTIEFALAVQS